MKPTALLLLDEPAPEIQSCVENFGYLVTDVKDSEVDLVLFSESHRNQVEDRFDCPLILVGGAPDNSLFRVDPQAGAEELKKVLEEIQKRSQDPIFEVRRLRQALRQQKRTRENFLALLSHELRTPLTLIMGNLHILRKLHSKEEVTSTASECVMAAMEGSKRLQARIQEMLHLTTGDRSPVESWDVSRTLATLVDEMEPLARGRSVRVEVENPAIQIEGRPLRLREALSHVLKNAILFNRFGGRVAVTSSHDDNCWHLLIEDEGRGMDALQQDRVFEPFYQAEEANTRTVDGLGLGLTLARRTVEAHRGELLVESTPGEGTRVKLRLPLTQGGSESQETAPPPAALPSHPQVPEALVDYAREVYQLYQAERERRLQAEEQQRITESTLVGTLVTLVRRIDPRGNLSLDQSERVLEYARAVARFLDPTLVSQPDFLYSILLYDIGKIGVTEAVLLKTGRLDGKERAKAEAHPVIGAQILESVGALHPAIDAVRHHHERWDGSGYPDGLRGTDIPILARLIAVVDTFDAMTVDRPYRKAMSLEEARVELEKLSGKHFDPQVISAFLEAWSEVELIAEKAGAGQPRSESEPGAAGGAVPAAAGRGEGTPG